MTGRRAAFAAEAESLSGTPFRFRGRDPRNGLDCVGLVIVALHRIGSALPPVPPYSMRQRDFSPMLTAATAAGFESVDDVPWPGDLLLLRAGPAQPHLAILAMNGGVIHAHAGLGRVVLTPPPWPLPIVRHWRLRED